MSARGGADTGICVHYVYSSEENVMNVYDIMVIVSMLLRWLFGG